ncbi:unnamed protein product [Blumeria hordei]|uniref:PB1 domain-containing protein n=1 Tax=Blumeria hordei TaxID=2867405 RepID=A0A383UV15_BLUHO|nr:unnamed protein product [Blumeria hordei]
MSLKQEIETWVAALNYYDNNQFEEALKGFEDIQDTSKINFNCGVIHATLGEHDKAIEMYQKAIILDQYLAVAYFQQGVSNFLLGDFEEALANFNDTLLYLRGNNLIDYAQLGLAFKLYSCEALFNRGLCYMYLEQEENGMQDFSYASKEKVIEDHEVIDEAIKEKAEGYTVFSIPVGVVYRPNQSKVKNLKTKDYLGKARLVAASDRSNAFTGFAGSEMKNAAKVDVKDDRPAENLSFAATNLVKPNLTSKRQDGEGGGSAVASSVPPLESDRKTSMSRAASVKNAMRPSLGSISTERSRPNDRNDEQSPLQANMRSRFPESRSSSMRRPASREQSRARRTTKPSDSDKDTYPGDVYDMYSNDNGKPPNRSSNRQKRNTRGGDVDEEDQSDYDGDSVEEGEFEIVSGKANGRSSTFPAVNRNSRRADVRQIRIKVHSEDVRYVLVDASVEFPDLVDRVREKFGLRKRFKIKVREDDTPDGDMITMGDQDDLDMVVMSAKAAARRNQLDVGKMEIWIVEG